MSMSRNTNNNTTIEKRFHIAQTFFRDRSGKVCVPNDQSSRLLLVLNTSDSKLDNMTSVSPIDDYRIDNSIESHNFITLPSIKRNSPMADRSHKVYLL